MASNNSRTNKFVPEGGGGWKKTPVQHPTRVAHPSPKHSDNKSEVLRYLKELFNQVLDKDIIYSVAEHCGWNVDPAIEALIELSQDDDTHINSHSSNHLESTHGVQFTTTPKTRNAAPLKVSTTVHQIIPSSSMAAIKVAYQGYDEDSDDADIIVEEEEEFEIVENGDEKLMQSIESSPNWPGSSITGTQNCCLREVKKVPKKCPILSRIEDYVSHGIRILVLMRGCPGSGKSHLAQELVAKFIDSKCDPTLYIFSTDQYFSRSGQYVYAPEHLPSAHDWNQKRVMSFMVKGFSPIIIDNTNTQVWEMLPYVRFAIRFGYAIQLLEPTTPWCWKESELARRNSHGVPRDKIRSMLDRYEKVTLNQLISSSKMSYATGNAPPQLCSNPIVGETEKSFPKEQTKMKSKTAIPTQTKQSRSVERLGNNSMRPAQQTVTSPVSIPKTVESDESSQALVMTMEPLQQGLQLSKTHDCVKGNAEVDQPKTDTSQQVNACSLNGVENSSLDQSTKTSNEENTITHAIDLVEEMLSDASGLTTLQPPVSIEVEEAVLSALLKDVSNELGIHIMEDSVERQVQCDEQLTPVASMNTCTEYVLMGADNDLLYQKSQEDVESGMGDPSKQNIDQLQSNSVDSILSCQDQAIANYLLATPVPVANEEQLICSDPLPDMMANMLDPAVDLKGVILKQNNQVISNISAQNLPSQNSAVQCTDERTNLLESTVSDSATKQTDTDNFLRKSGHKSDVKKCTKTQDKDNFSIKIVESISTEKALPKLDLFSWFFSKKKVPPDTAELKPTNCIQEDLPTFASIEDNFKRVDPNQGHSESPVILEDGSPVSQQPKTWQLTNSWHQSELQNKAPETSQVMHTFSEQSSSSSSTESCSEVPNPSTDSNMSKATEIDALIDQTPTDSRHCYNNAEESIATVNDSTSLELQIVSASDNLNSMDSATTDFSLLGSLISCDIVSKHVQKLTASAQPVTELASNDSQGDTANLQPPVAELSSLSIVDTSDQNILDITPSSDSLCLDFLSSSSGQDMVTGGELGSHSHKYAGAWSRMSPSNLLKDDGIPLKTNLAVPELGPKIPMTDSETNTSHSDFSLLEQESSADLRFISGHNRSINDGKNNDTARAVVAISTLDKSSMTIPEDFDSGQPDFELLVNMFPKIPREDLKELFEKCLGEMNWTVDLLLESGHAFEPSESLEIRFDNTEDLKVTQQLLEELDMRDMKRSVEFDVGNSVTLGFDTSETAQESQIFLEAAGGSSVYQPSLSSSPAKKGSKKQTSELSLRLKKEMEKNIDLSESSYSEHMLRIKKIRHGQPLNNSTTTDSNTTENADSVVQDVCSESSVTTQDHVSLRRVEHESTNQDADMDIDEDEDVIPLTLDSEFLTHLQTLFGETAFPYLEGVAPIVDVPLTLARQIHGLLMEAQQKQFDMQEKYFEDMIKDEEFARRLQEEEMPPPDFRQIMDMEIALELYKTDITKVHRETKDDLATRLSKQKLVQLFPTVDSDMLFDVFAAHGNSFQETLEVLEASTGEPEEAVRNVMSPEALLLYEKRLMEQAKQESSKQLEVESDLTDSTCGRSVLARTALSKDQALAEAKYYREEANRQYELRNQCYQKANDAMRNGQKAVASYYAQVGRLYKQYIEDANARAAACLLTAHTMSQRSTTLDLHFLFVVEAVQALDIFLDHHISRLSESGKNLQNLFVITGGGNHSMGGRPRIKPAVQRRLSQRGVKYYELNPGHLKVVITRHLLLSNGN